MSQVRILSPRPLILLAFLLPKYHWVLGRNWSGSDSGSHVRPRPTSISFCNEFRPGGLAHSNDELPQVVGSRGRGVPSVVLSVITGAWLHYGAPKEMTQTDSEFDALPIARQPVREGPLAALLEWQAMAEGAYSANPVRAQKADGAIFQVFCEARGEAYLPAESQTHPRFHRGSRRPFRGRKSSRYR